MSNAKSEKLTGKTTVSLGQARAHLTELCEQVTEDREPVHITRRDAEDVVLLAADEYDSLIETAHLLRSPKNAERLLSALARSLAERGTPIDLDEFLSERGLAAPR